MRKFFVSSLAALALLVSISNTAHAQDFLLGLAVGSAMNSGGGSSTSIYGGGTSTVVYVLPRLEERIANPLDVRVLSTGTISLGYKSNLYGADDFRGASFQNMFNFISKVDASKFTVLEVKEVLSPTDVERVNYWFYFIENAEVKPLDSLPPLPK